MQLDEKDISHTVQYVTPPNGTPGSAVVGIDIPVGLSSPGLDPAHHRLMDYIGNADRDSIIIKYGDTVMFTGHQAQVSDVRIGTDHTTFTMTIPADPAGGATTG